jgi:hypothetical protein
MPNRLMTAHKLDAVRGYHKTYALVKRLPFNPTQLAAIDGGIAIRGRCVHINNDMEYEFGVASNKVPLFLHSNSNSPAVNLDSGDVETDYLAGASSAEGIQLALCGLGDFELKTTEFDATRTYTVNEPLTAATGTTLATAGVVTNNGAAFGSGAVCGIVSENRVPGQRTADNMTTLTFWSYFSPSHPG